MDTNIPKYLIYFDLNDNIPYNNEELQAVKKIVSNIIQNRYFVYGVEVQFNKEILNYDLVKEKLSDNIMVLITQVSDNIIEDLISEVKYILGDRKILKIKSANDFNKTGYSDSQLQEMYKNYLVKSECLEFEENEKINNFKENFKIDNLPLLGNEDYLAFANLFVLNVEDLNGFGLIDNYNVVDALYTNFHFLIRYFSLIDYDNLVTYYQKDTITILRNIRRYTSSSDDYNDNIKELLLYKHILLQLGVGVFFFDPEEGLTEIKNKLDEIAKRRRDAQVLELSTKFKLFNNNYQIISVGDEKSKIFSSYKIVGNSFYKHFEKLRPLIRSFKDISNNIVKFNSKMVNDERIIKTLDLLLKHKIIENYTSKYGSYTIYIENHEHITFLQGKWFEFYTAKLCEEVILNYQSQGYYPDYGIYQNLIIKFDEYYRELDIVLYLNGQIFYIENKIDVRNTYRYDIDKYMNNIKNMNLDHNNCYLVSLEGEETTYDYIKVMPINTFNREFKKEVLKILEVDKQKRSEEIKSTEASLKDKKQSNALINRNMNSLYLTYFNDIDKQVSKFEKIKDKYENNCKELIFDKYERLIHELKEYSFDKELNDVIVWVNDYKNGDINKLRHNDNLNKILNISHPKSKYFANAFSILYSNDSLELMPSMYDDAKLWLLYNLKVADFVEILSRFYAQDVPLSIAKITNFIYFYIKNVEVKEDLEFLSKKFYDMILNYYSKLNEKISKTVSNHKNEFIIRHEEFEHIIAVVSAFMERFYKTIYNDYLNVNDIEEFINRIMNNNYYYSYCLKKNNLLFSNINFEKEYFNEINCINAANYLYLNQKYLINEENFINNIDKDKLTFSLTRDDKSLKLINLLLESKLIKEFREVKKANVYVGIFSDCYSYTWITKKLWIGNYLSFKYQTNFIYTNLLINKLYYIVFIKKYNNEDYVCLRRDISNSSRYALIDIKNIKDIKDQMFVYELDKLEEICNDRFGGKL